MSLVKHPRGEVDEAARYTKPDAYAIAARLNPFA